MGKKESTFRPQYLREKSKGRTLLSRDNGDRKVGKKESTFRPQYLREKSKGRTLFKLTYCKVS